MNIDSIYSDQNQDRLSPFNTSAKPISKMSKLRTEKVIKSPQHSSKLSIQEIEKQILKQISITEDTMKAFDEGLSAIIGKKSLNTFTDDHSDNKSTNSPVNIERLRNLEESIRRKDQIIKQIDEDIKMLKNGTYYDTKDKNQENNFEKFINEIKDQRQNLIRTQNMLMGKVREVQNKKEVIKNVEAKYRDKCRKEGSQFITFEAFKEAEIKRRKEMKKMEKYRKGSQKKMGSSIKQYPSHSSKNLTPQTHNSIHGADSKKMKDLLNRKNVAETALKTAKKKHILQLNDLYGKRDFLLDENQDLQQKLIMKENQLNMAEKKFSQTRGSISAKKISERRYKTEKNL